MTELAHNKLDQNKLDQNKLHQNKLDLYSSFNNHCKRNILHTKYKNDEKCSICLLTMLNTLVLHTPCQHYFHHNCIKSVYTSDHIAKYNCPLCRYDLSEAIYNTINIQHKNLGSNVRPNNVVPNAGPNAVIVDFFDLNIFLLDLSILDLSDMVDNDGNEIVMNGAVHQELINVVSSVINLIKYSFHPDCFQIMMLTNLTPTANADANDDANIANEPIICHLCNYKFLEYLHSDESSIQINDHSYDIINEYVTSHPTIFNLIHDVMQIMDFETLQHAIDFIYHDNIIQYHH